GRRSILGGRTFRHVHVDVLVVEGGRLDAEAGRLGAHIRARRVDRLLHHLAELAGGLHAALAGQHDGLDLHRLAADFRPGETGDDADLILALHLAVAPFAHAGIGAEVLRRHLDRRGLARDDLLHGLAGKARNLALEIAHARFARVVADQVAQTVVADL